jgi:uncharacterized membrane-anchored protein YjiN (DUF445 family)
MEREHERPYELAHEIKSRFSVDEFMTLKQIVRMRGSSYLTRQKLHTWIAGYNKWAVKNRVGIHKKDENCSEFYKYHAMCSKLSGGQGREKCYRINRNILLPGEVKVNSELLSVPSFQIDKDSEWLFEEEPESAIETSPRIEDELPLQKVQEEECAVVEDKRIEDVLEKLETLVDKEHLYEFSSKISAVFEENVKTMMEDCVRKETFIERVEEAREALKVLDGNLQRLTTSIPHLETRIESLSDKVADGEKMVKKDVAQMYNMVTENHNSIRAVLESLPRKVHEIVQPILSNFCGNIPLKEMIKENVQPLLERFVKTVIGKMGQFEKRQNEKFEAFSQKCWKDCREAMEKTLDQNHKRLRGELLSEIEKHHKEFLEDCERDREERWSMMEQDDVWMQKYNALMTFINEKGEWPKKCDNPSESTLAGWVKMQVSLMKKGKLVKDRLERMQYLFTGTGELAFPRSGLCPPGSA